LTHLPAWCSPPALLLPPLLLLLLLLLLPPLPLLLQKEGDYYDNAGYTETAGYTGTTTTTDDVVETPVAVGVAEVPVVVTEQQAVSNTTAGYAGQEEVCGQKTFTEVEDRPVVKERVERYVEHHPVEKQYIVETRYLGETPVASSQAVTPIGVDERVVEAAEPGPKCSNSAGAQMDAAMGGRTL
jgi:hypothetical protein